MTDRTASSTDAAKRRADERGARVESFNDFIARVYRWAPPSSRFISCRGGLIDSDHLNTCPAPHAQPQEPPMTKHDRHAEIKALLTEIRDTLLATSGAKPKPIKPTPTDDLPGEPVEPGDLRAGDRVGFTYRGERITGNLVSALGGTILRSDIPDLGGYHPGVVFSSEWGSGISDVRRLERAPREDEDDERVRLGKHVQAVRDGSGYAIELGGVRIAKCDTYGHTLDERAAITRAEKAEAERDEWREVAARYADGRDKWQAKWRESDEARERAETALADERDLHDATITERDALRDERDEWKARHAALRADVGGSRTLRDVIEALARDDERAAKGEKR